MQGVARRAGRLVSGPIGLIGRDRPIELLDRLRGHDPLPGAVRGKVVMITGASSGIGRATAERIGAAGATVVLVARSADALGEVRDKIEHDGGQAFVHRCDLTDFDALDAMAAAVVERHGRVDVLVNNAGRSIRRSLALSYDRFHDYERTMALNYFAPVRLILALVPGMRERREGQVINISSVGVQTRVPRYGAYIASKAALDTLSDALQAEVHADGVLFTTVHMPLVRTAMISPTKLYDRFPALTAEQAAGVVTRAIVHRARRVSPPFGHAAAFVDALSPELMDIVRSQGFRAFGESRAARGVAPSADGRPGVDEQADAAGTAFAHLTRGVHW